MNILFVHHDTEVLLEVNYTPEIPGTRFQPPEPEELEVLEGHTREGDVLDDDLLAHLQNEHYEELYEAVEREKEMELGEADAVRELCRKEVNSVH